jgi:DNA-binding NtrC family response regulator
MNEIRPKVDASVLVVEDEPRMRELLVRAVASWGLCTQGARSAEEALRTMRERPSDMVVLDLNLPGMGGMELFELIRRQWPDTQVIVLTGFGDLESARQAIHLDVVEFLTKPCHLGELEQAVDRARKRIAPTMPEQPAEDPAPTPPPPSSSATLDELERQHILAALSRNQGNRTATATELGISLRTMYYRLSEYQKQGYNVE